MPSVMVGLGFGCLRPWFCVSMSTMKPETNHLEVSRRAFSGLALIAHPPRGSKTPEVFRLVEQGCRPALRADGRQKGHSL